jgi:NET1-associated nuclear protein 1 (U3 small nucleolar RNA-associated protein 17)
MYGTRQDERETKEQARLRLTTAQQMREEAMSANRKETKARRKEEGDTGLSAPSHVLPQVENLFDTFMSSIMTLRIEPKDSTVVAMDVDAEEEMAMAPAIEVTDNVLIEDNIINPPQVDFPSLLDYFSKGLGKTNRMILF